MGSKQRSRRASGGFSLIEILIVVSVIILLLGIGVVGGAKFIQAAKIKQVETMMQGLVAANDEFRAQRKQGSINHGTQFPINWAQRGPNLTSSQRFVVACRTNKKVEAQMLAAAISGEADERQALKDDGGLYDVWGTQIVYRSFNNGRTDDVNENPVRTVLNVDNDKLPLSQSPFFVSAGPDREFHTEDDITSFLE